MKWNKLLVSTPSFFMVATARLHQSSEKEHDAQGARERVAVLCAGWMGRCSTPAKADDFDHWPVTLTDR